MPEVAVSETDVLIVGGGAAGLATAIFTARAVPGLRITVLDGAARLGAKILVSGGGRCNVTNRVVTERDYWGGSSNSIRRVLAAFPAERAAAFFRELGVALHEEENGKLFPDSNRARTVVDALLRETQRLGVAIRCGQRVTAIRHTAADSLPFAITSTAAEWRASVVVLATGGLSLPKTGSDGGGYALARALGHTLTPTFPGLAPLLLTGGFHAALSGVSCEVELTVRIAGEKPLRFAGPLLWTHFGVSGPVVLNASRHWSRARYEQKDVLLSVNFFPGRDAAALEQALSQLAAEEPRRRLAAIFVERLPARLAAALLTECALDPAGRIGNLSRERRRGLAERLTAWPLSVLENRGFGYAEVTAGGVSLNEIDPATMASRRCTGLFLVGEILDVDGRLGGFNFQWAWSSAYVAASGISRCVSASE